MKYAKYCMDVQCKYFIRVDMEDLGNSRLERDHVMGASMTLLTLW